MKNSRVLITILLSAVAGYLAYPRFNQSQIDPDLVSEPSEKRKYPTSSGAGGSENQNADEEKAHRPKEPTPVPVPAETEVVLAPEASREGISDDSSEEKTKSSKSANRSGGLGGSTFRAGSERDFSTYKLSKSEQRLDISPRDPRLLLIRGFYEGFFDSSTVDLEIGGSESSIQFVNDSVSNEELSFSAPNETFFSNVHDNGNLLLIEKGKNKLYINIQSWPTLKLMMGTKTEVFLRRTR